MDGKLEYLVPATVWMLEDQMGNILELVEMEREKNETSGQTSRVLEIPAQSNGRRFVRNLEVISSPFPASCYPERPLMLSTTTLLKDPKRSHFPLPLRPLDSSIHNTHLSWSKGTLVEASTVLRLGEVR